MEEKVFVDFRKDEHRKAIQEKIYAREVKNETMEQTYEE